MRTLRFFAPGIGVTTLLWAGFWSAHLAHAQSPPAEKLCVSIHDTHPTLKPDEARQAGVPAGYRVYRLDESYGGEELLLREEPLIQPSEMAEVRSTLDEQSNQPVVSVRFDAEGTRKFATHTQNNVGRKLAIVVGGSRVISAPIIQSPILGGSVQISGSLTADDAERLAEQMRSGMCK